MQTNAAPATLGIHQLIEENTQGLHQLITLVSNLSPETYQQRFGMHGQHTVGKHVRHLIDHYVALLNGLYPPLYKVDYENRQREAMLENNPEAACTCMGTLCDSLAWINHEHQQTRPVLVNHQTATGCLGANSSLARELIFLSSHTVHHMAIIGLLAEQIGMQPACDFGVHPSTLRYWQHEQAKQQETS